MTPYRTPARVTPVPLATPTLAPWLGAGMFAVASGLELAQLPLGHTPTLVAMLGTAFVAALQPIVHTRARPAALVTLALAVPALGSSTLAILAGCACAWLALETARPLRRSPWPVLVAAALALAGVQRAVPLAFAVVFAMNASGLTRLSPLTAPVPWRRELEVVGAAFLVIATLTFAASRSASIGVFVLFALAMFRRGRSLPLPVPIYVYGAAVAAAFAAFATTERSSGFATGCAWALEALAIAGYGMFLPAKSPFKFAVTVAGLLLGCAGFVQMLPWPWDSLRWFAFIPSAAFVAIALTQAHGLKPNLDEADSTD